MNEKSEALIKKALEQLQNSPTGEISLKSRRLLWESITQDSTVDEKKLKLTKLDSLCVIYGAPIWLKKFNSDNELKQILDVANKVATGVITQDDGLAIRDEFYVDVVENQSYEPYEYPAMFIGHAAANTIVTATDNLFFDPTDDTDDYDLDPEAFEPSYLVASAFAGGLDRNGDPEQRRSFWGWYLSTALYQVA